MDIRTRIITEAGKLFFARGIKSVTMDDIASSTGISKKTIYEHFANKRALLAEWFDVHFATNDALLEKKICTFTNPIEMLLLAFDKLSLESRRSHIQFMLDTEKYYPDIYQQKIESRQEMIASKFATFIDDGKRDGYFLPEAPTYVLAVLSHELMRILGSEKLFPLEKYKNIDVFKDTFLMLMRGIVTDKGRKLIDDAINQTTVQNTSK